MKKLTLLFAAALLVACQQSNVSESDETVTNAKTSHSSTAEKHKEKSDAALHGSKSTGNAMVQSVKANSSSLQFTHRTSSERAQIGVPYEIEIDFMGATEDGFTADFSVTPGLSLATPNRSLVRAEKQSAPTTQKITVIPQKEGIHFLNIYKVGAEQLKPSAIKIIVGDKDIKEYMETVGEVIELEDGSKVISMKADESN